MVVVSGKVSSMQIFGVLSRQDFGLHDAIICKGMIIVKTTKGYDVK